MGKQILITNINPDLKDKFKIFVSAFSETMQGRLIKLMEWDMKANKNKAIDVFKAIDEGIDQADNKNALQ